MDLCFFSLYFYYPLGYNVAELGSIVTYASVPSILFLPLIGYLVDHGWGKEVMIASGILLSLPLILPPVLPAMSTFVFIVHVSLTELVSINVCEKQDNREKCVTNTYRQNI